MTTYMVRSAAGIRVGATGLCVGQGYPVSDSMIANPALVRTMVEEGVIDQISDVRALAIDALTQVPGIYPQLAEDLIGEGIPSEAEIEEAEGRGIDPRMVALKAIMNADVSQLVKVRGIGEVKAERLQMNARAAALRMGR